MPTFLYVFCAKLQDEAQKAIENGTPVYFCLHNVFYIFLFNSFLGIFAALLGAEEKEVKQLEICQEAG